MPQEAALMSIYQRALGDEFERLSPLRPRGVEWQQQGQGDPVEE